MTDAAITAIVAAVPLTLAAVGALISSLRNAKKIDDVHVAINSRMDQMLALQKAGSFADGVKHEADKTAVAEGVKAVAFAAGVESAIIPITLPKPISPKEAELMRLIEQLNHEIEALKTGGNQ